MPWPCSRGSGQTILQHNFADTLHITIDNGLITVREGKEAWRKGVRTGDYILEYNGVPIRDICTYILLKKRDKDSAYKFVSPDGTVKEVVFSE